MNNMKIILERWNNWRESEKKILNEAPRQRLGDAGYDPEIGEFKQVFDSMSIEAYNKNAKILRWLINSLTEISEAVSSATDSDEETRTKFTGRAGVGQSEIAGAVSRAEQSMRFGAEDLKEVDADFINGISQVIAWGMKVLDALLDGEKNKEAGNNMPLAGWQDEDKDKFKDAFFGLEMSAITKILKHPLVMKALGAAAVEAAIKELVPFGKLLVRGWKIWSAVKRLVAGGIEAFAGSSNGKKALDALVDEIAMSKDSVNQTEFQKTLNIHDQYVHLVKKELLFKFLQFYRSEVLDALPDTTRMSQIPDINVEIIAWLKKETGAAPSRKKVRDVKFDASIGTGGGRRKSRIKGV